MAAASHITRRTLVAGAAVLAVPAAVAATAHPDAALLALEIDFDAAWGRERAVYEAWRSICSDAADAATDAACDKTSGVVQRIIDVPARTLDGLRVKARAISWCSGGDDVDLDVQGTTDLQLATSIVRDLLRVA
jgi:hypothetical protein